MGCVVQCALLEIWQPSEVSYLTGAMLQELVNNLAMVNIENKFGETPLDRSEASLAQTLQGILFIPVLQAYFIHVRIVCF